MSKTAKQELDDKIEDLQLKLIEVNAALDVLMPATEQEFMGHDPARAQERRMHEAKREAITNQITFLVGKISQISQSPGHSQRPKSTKQATVYAEILKLKKRNPSLKNEEAFERLANKLDDSEEAIRKAFYAEQRRLTEVATSTAKEKRDSERESDEQDQGKK
jgi:hypothetical protein